MPDAFKNWRCLDSPPQSGGWMNPSARQACIRKGDHPGPHRNRYWEWDEGQKELARPRKDRDA